MQGVLRVGLALVLAVTVIAVIANTWEQSTEQDKQLVAQLTNRMKTVCGGRFLIDLPAEAQLDIVRARSGGFDVAAFHETKKEFQKRLTERQNQIATASDRFGRNRNLESASVVTGISGLVVKCSCTVGPSLKALQRMV